jgi:hypothetical protein
LLHFHGSSPPFMNIIIADLQRVFDRKKLSLRKIQGSP